MELPTGRKLTGLLGKSFDRAEESAVDFGSSVTGRAVVVDNVVELLLRKTLNRFELERRLVTAATVVASVEGAEVVVVVVVTVVRALAPKRRPVLGSRLDGITLSEAGAGVGGASVAGAVAVARIATIGSWVVVAWNRSNFLFFKNSTKP